MSFKCPYRDVCEAGAFIDTAVIFEQLPDIVLNEMGWKVGALVTGAAFDMLTSDERTALRDVYR